MLTVIRGVDKVFVRFVKSLPLGAGFIFIEASLEDSFRRISLSLTFVISRSSGERLEIKSSCLIFYLLLLYIFNILFLELSYTEDLADSKSKFLIAD